MMQFRIYSYSMKSKGINAIKKALIEAGHEALLVYPDRSYVYKPEHKLINWGFTRQPIWDDGSLINSRMAVHNSVNKIRTLQNLVHNDVPTLNFTLNKSEAQFNATSGKVFCRTLTSSSQGKGIVIATNPSEVVDAPLYTLEFPKTHEFRIHVARGNIFHIQEKRKREGSENLNRDVWNHGNDFVFCIQNINLPDCVAEASVKAVEALGLDFGAVDVGYNSRTNQCAVFEVNSAPAVTGTTISKYVNMFMEI